MVRKSWSDALQPLPGDSPAKVIFMNDSAEVITSRNSTAGTKALASIKRISKNQYVDESTGEVFDYSEYTGRADNYAGMKESLKKVRLLILNNFPAFESFYITLTYKDKEYDFNKAVRDFNKFYERLRYRYNQHHLEYLRLVEAHHDGAWHFHLLLKPAEKGVSIKMSKYVLEDIWGLGSVKMRQIYNPEGIAAYLATVHNESGRNCYGNLAHKTVIKQHYWEYYPKGARIFSASKGIAYPDVVRTTRQNAERLLTGYIPKGHSSVIISDTESGVVLNTVNYEYYLRNHQI